MVPLRQMISRRPVLPDTLISKILQVFLFKQRHMLPLRFSASVPCRMPVLAMINT